MTSAVLIVPAAYHDEANAFAVEQGWGENSLSVPLSPTGQEPATHWACRADVGPSFIDMVENPSPENQPLVEVLIYSFEDNVDPYDHWTRVFAENNLAVAYPPEE
jgi:hypothetical protein